MEAEETKTLAYQVKTPTFEGPLELLLSLIEARKLFINEISLADVTGDYLSYVKEIKNMPLEEGTQFLTIASTLVLIKSRSLLPNLALTEDEESKIGDLERRLKLYQVLKDASQFVKEQYGKKVLFLGEPRGFSTPIFAPDQTITSKNLQMLVQEVFEKIPKPIERPEVTVQKVISIEEMIDDVIKRVTDSMSISFSELVKSHSGETMGEKKTTIIVGFLAMLELVRSGIIDVLQNSAFDDIAISKLSKLEKTELTNNIENPKE